MWTPGAIGRGGGKGAHRFKDVRGEEQQKQKREGRQLVRGTSPQRWVGGTFVSHLSHVCLLPFGSWCMHLGFTSWWCSEDSGQGVLFYSCEEEAAKARAVDHSPVQSSL